MRYYILEPCTQASNMTLSTHVWLTPGPHAPLYTVYVPFTAEHFCIRSYGASIQRNTHAHQSRFRQSRPYPAGTYVLSVYYRKPRATGDTHTMHSMLSWKPTMLQQHSARISI